MKPKRASEGIQFISDRLSRYIDWSRKSEVEISWNLNESRFQDRGHFSCYLSLAIPLQALALPRIRRQQARDIIEEAKLRIIYAARGCGNTSRGREKEREVERQRWGNAWIPSHVLAYTHSFVRWQWCSTVRVGGQAAHRGYGSIVSRFICVQWVEWWTGDRHESFKGVFISVDVS